MPRSAPRKARSARHAITAPRDNNAPVMPRTAAVRRNQVIRRGRPSRPRGVIRVPGSSPASVQCGLRVNVDYFITTASAISNSAWRRFACKLQQTFCCPHGVHLGCSGRQFRITLRDEASAAFSLIIRNRLPSGEISQLIGPVRIPVSTICVLNRASGVPD